MNHINEIRDFKMFKLNINNKQIVCYWDLTRNEYQFFRSPIPLNKSELREMKRIIKRELGTMTAKDFVFGLKVLDLKTGETRYLFELGKDAKGVPGVYIDRGNIMDEKIEFRYFNQIKIINK